MAVAKKTMAADEMTLDEKLFSIQQELGKLSKTSTGYNYNYMTLEDLWEVLKPLFAKHKLVWKTRTVYMADNEGGLHQNSDGFVVFMLESSIETIGDKEVITSSIPIVATTPQNVGGQLTYYRRYLLSTMLGITFADPDDDAKNITFKQKSRPKPTPDQLGGEEF